MQKSNSQKQWTPFETLSCASVVLFGILAFPVAVSFFHAGLLVAPGHPSGSDALMFIDGTIINGHTEREPDRIENDDWHMPYIFGVEAVMEDFYIGDFATKKWSVFGIGHIERINPFPPRNPPAVWACSVPVWPLLFPLLWVPAIWFVRRRKSLLRESRGVCSRCAYDLRASPERCPECGKTVAREKASTA